MPTSKTVKRVPGAGGKSGPVMFQKFASTRMVDVQTAKARTGAATPYGGKNTTMGEGGGSMEGWRQSRMRPKGGPELTESRRGRR